MRYQAAISIGSAEFTHIVAADDEQDAILRLGILIGMRLPHVNVDSVSLHAIQSEAEAFPDDSCQIKLGLVPGATPDQAHAARQEIIACPACARLRKYAAQQEAIANGAFD